jgi:hypothetical protein
MARRKDRRSLVLAGLWVLGGVAAFCGSAYLSLAMIGTPQVLLEIRSEPRSLAHGLELAAWLILWAVLAGIGIALVTAVLFPPVHFSMLGLASALSGVVVAAGLDLSLQQRAAGRGLDYSYDLVGPSIVLPAIVIAIAVSIFALAQAPLVIRPLVRVTVGMLAAAALAVAATNLWGVRDGIAQDSLLLAALLFLTSAYVVATAAHQLRGLPNDLSGLFDATD